MRFKTNKKGFTLIELIVTVSIMAVFTAILVPSFTHMAREARADKDDVKFTTICTALKSSLSQPEVQKEMAGFNNNSFTIVFSSDAATGEMNLMKGEVIISDTESYTLDELELGNNSWQLMDKTYKVENKNAYGYKLTVSCTPKTEKTMPKVEIVSWAAQQAGG